MGELKRPNDFMRGSKGSGSGGVTSPPLCIASPPFLSQAAVATWQVPQAVARPLVQLEV